MRESYLRSFKTYFLPDAVEFTRAWQMSIDAYGEEAFLTRLR